MFEKIFNEIFGDVDFEKVFKNFPEEEKKNESENDHSYFHTIKDRYENGEHVSHVEKEVKDGKVIKDINNTFKIEDKGEKEETKNGSEYYEEKLKKATDLLEEAQKTIINQQKQIETYENHCKELECKFRKLKDFLN